MPSVWSQFMGADKRVYIYGAVIALSSIGLIHFKQSLSKRDEIQIFTQQTTINKMDLITTELPLLIAPFAGIDAIHYSTEIIYDLIKTQTINDKLAKNCLISTLLGFGLPIVYVLRNHNIKVKNNGIRIGVKRFIYHIGSITFLCAIFGITYRAILWSLKFSVSTPFFIIGTALIYKMYKRLNKVNIYTDRALQIDSMVRSVIGVVSFLVGRKVYVRLRDYEQYRMQKIYGGITRMVNKILNKFIWNDMDLKYVLLSGIFVSNLFNFLMDSTVSKFFMPFSFKIRNRFLEQSNYWIYESYYYYISDVNNTLPKEICCEIFSYAGIEQDFKFLIENDKCRIQYEEKHSYVGELSILAHICFSYVSYRELYHRIKAKLHCDLHPISNY
eukprot:442700_1